MGNKTTVLRYCRIGKQYVKPECKPGEVCKPIEGHFATECEVKDCKQFN